MVQSTVSLLTLVIVQPVTAAGLQLYGAVWPGPAGLTGAGPGAGLTGAGPVARAGCWTEVQGTVGSTPARLTDTGPRLTVSVERTPRVTESSGAVLSSPPRLALLHHRLLGQQGVRADHLQAGGGRDVAGDAFKARETLAGPVETDPMVCTVLRTEELVTVRTGVSLVTDTGEVLLTVSVMVTGLGGAVRQTEVTPRSQPAGQTVTAAPREKETVETLARTGETSVHQGTVRAGPGRFR